MINATANPTSFVKQPLISQPVVGPVPTAPPMNFKRSSEPTKIFGLELRSVLTVLGLTLFFLLAMGGVIVALNQYMNSSTPVAPNAPASRPKADITKPAICTLRFTVAAGPTPTPTPTPTGTPTPTPTVTPTPTPTPTPTFYCDSSCSANSDCTQANSSYICWSTNNHCRLNSNPSSPTCTAVGCNETCSTNADCSNTALVCIDTSIGRRCRLDSNPNSETCTLPSTTTYTTTQTVVQQQAQTAVVVPQTTTVLPKTGSEGMGGLFMAGLAVIGGGVLLILML